MADPTRAFEAKPKRVVARALIAALAISASAIVGCLPLDLRQDTAPDPPPVLADDDPRYARALGLGDEYEVTRRIQVFEYALLTERQRPVGGSLHLGYLEPGTRLRVTHVWRVPPDRSAGIGGSTLTLRVVPDHDPWRRPFKPGDVSPAWTRQPDGAAGNAYVLNPDFVRRVAPEERTPDRLIEPLTVRQEWPRGKPG